MFTEKSITLNIDKKRIDEDIERTLRNKKSNLLSDCIADLESSGYLYRFLLNEDLKGFINEQTIDEERFISDCMVEYADVIWFYVKLNIEPIDEAEMYIKYNSIKYEWAENSITFKVHTRYDYTYDIAEIEKNFNDNWYYEKSESLYCNVNLYSKNCRKGI